MNNLPTLRTNIATWAVAVEQIPVVTEIMLDSLPPEDYDPSFKGQQLETTYIDTPRLELRKNRLNHEGRIECQEPFLRPVWASKSSHQAMA